MRHPVTLPKSLRLRLNSREKCLAEHVQAARDARWHLLRAVTNYTKPAPGAFDLRAYDLKAARASAEAARFWLEMMGE